MTFTPDYVERVYAGVLGKLVGVYLGRPFEGWWKDEIEARLGEIQYYVHDKLNLPLIVADDDISGTFTFLRALPDHGNSPDLSAAQIGETWLNYLIEKKTILWWGGKGISTEHTAYLNLKHGIPSPQSGSTAVNGPIVAEQIGSQIFIDGWAMLAPGDPHKAAELARRAASVSHDGEAIYGAQSMAAMEALAFVESDIAKLIAAAREVIPNQSIIYRMAGDLQEWHAADGDWRKTYARIANQYGYANYVGGCHMIPNHALILLGLLYGAGDFQKSMMVVNTAGWDTDCNAGNLGCLMGIRNGLSGFAGAVDWLGPVADRMFLPTADGARCITDAVTETFHVVNAARGMAGLAALSPKGGARYHFDLPGAIQGVRVEQSADCSPYVTLENVAGHTRQGSRSLALRYRCVGGRVVARAAAATFLQPQDVILKGYEIVASPTLWPGQTVTATLSADEDNAGEAQARLYIQYIDGDDQPARAYHTPHSIAPGAFATLTWQIPDLWTLAPQGVLIYNVGLEVSRPHEEAADLAGAVYLDTLTWQGAAQTTLKRPANAAAMQYRANWTNAVELFDQGAPAGESFKLVQNEGCGMLLTGGRDWRDLTISTRVRPVLMQAGGLAVRVQGLRRFYALELTEAHTLRLTRVYEGQETTLAEMPCDWQWWQPLELALQAEGDVLRAWADGREVFTVQDADSPLRDGGVALTVTGGTMLFGDVTLG